MSPIRILPLTSSSLSPRLLPSIVTRVPPSIGPLSGLIYIQKRGGEEGEERININACLLLMVGDGNRLKAAQGPLYFFRLSFYYKYIDMPRA